MITGQFIAEKNQYRLSAHELTLAAPLALDKWYRVFSLLEF